MAAPLEIAGMLNDLPSETLSLTRLGSHTVDDYGRVTSTASTSSFTAAVFPAGRRTLENLPEAFRGRDTISLHTLTEIRVDDRIGYLSRSYRVVRAGDYASWTDGCYFAHAVEEDSTT